MERLKLRPSILLVALAITLGGCDNPLDLLAALEVSVMRANQRYLEVQAITIPLEGGTFSPTGTIEIDFDRPIDLASVTPETVRIVPDGGTAIDYPDQGISYVAGANKLRIRVYPYLDVDKDYSIEVRGVRGQDGSVLYERPSRNFRTRGATVGSITQLYGTLAGSQPGYAINRIINADIAINEYMTHYKYEVKYQLEGGTITSWVDKQASWQSRANLGENTINLGNRTLGADGQVTVWLKVWGSTGSGDGEEGIPDEAVIIIDTVAPNAPVSLSEPASPTLNSSVTWSWKGGGGGGAGVYQAALNSSDWSAEFSGSMHTRSSLLDGLYTLGVRERDAAGNWSAEAQSPTPVRVTSVFPYDGETGVSRTPLLQWRSMGTGQTYSVEVYNGVSWVEITSTTNTSFQFRFAGQLDPATTYRWRVRYLFKSFIRYLPGTSGAEFTTK